MADPTSPFSPDFQAPGAPQAPVADLTARWSNFLSDPASRAALMSAGAALAQPMGFGQTPIGHASRALGAGGEAVTRMDDAVRKDADAESKTTLRESQADAATRRAQVAEANSNTAAVRAGSAMESARVNDDLRRAKIETERARVGQLEARKLQLETMAALYPQNAEAQNAARLARAEYDNARTGVVQQDADARSQNANTRQQSQQDRTTLRTQEIEQRDREGAANRTSREGIASGRQTGSDRAAYDRYASDPLRAGPALPFEEWKKSRGGGSGPAQGVPSQPSVPAPSAPSRPQAPLTTPAGGIQAAPPAAQRQMDSVYMTPKGPLRWKGTGWEQL